MTPEETKRQILARLQEDADVQRMREFVQHGRISTYEHCERVAELSWRIDRFFSLHSDPDVLLTGAMLHDFYLYDWHRADNGEHRLHGFRHAKTARRNAEEHFRIGGETGHVIDSHMWPLNPERVPRSKEAWIVCIADKLVSLHETLFLRQRKTDNGNAGQEDGKIQGGQ